MYNFLLQTIIMVSAGTIVYLIARAAPRISEESSPMPRESYFDVMIKKLPLEKADTAVNSAMEKLLRKLKVFVLKLDNWVSGNLAKLRPHEEKKEESAKPNLFEKTGKDATIEE